MQSHTLAWRWRLHPLRPAELRSSEKPRDMCCLALAEEACPCPRPPPPSAEPRGAHGLQDSHLLPRPAPRVCCESRLAPTPSPHPEPVQLPLEFRMDLPAAAALSRPGQCHGRAATCPRSIPGYPMAGRRPSPWPRSAPTGQKLSKVPPGCKIPKKHDLPAAGGLPRHTAFTRAPGQSFQGPVHTHEAAWGSPLPPSAAGLAPA